MQRCRKQKLSGGAKVNIINIYIILLCITQKIWGGHGPLAPPLSYAYGMHALYSDSTISLDTYILLYIHESVYFVFSGF